VQFLKSKINHPIQKKDFENNYSLIEPKIDVEGIEIKMCVFGVCLKRLMSRVRKLAYVLENWPNTKDVIN